jgi:uncharacterized membrane protein
MEKSSFKQGSRIQSVDLLRGAVMVLMAIDHVRVYSGIPSGGPDPAVFFTRWITHFCVPAFVFLAGSSAFLYGQKINDGRALARFLLTRGFFLVLLELTLIRLFWTFNMNFQQFTLAGVIWMLGWCMVLMAALVRFSVRTLWICGLVMIFFQQIFGLVPDLLPLSWRAHFGWFWEFFYSSGFDGPPGISILYVLLPWIGVMMAGYGFGLILTSEPGRRRKICLWIGLGSVLLFLIAGSLMTYFGPVHNNHLPFILRMLAQQKYPPSQLYLLMTLGPLIALVPFAEKVRGWFARVLITFGRVPLFYYLLHILLIHIAALIVNFFREGNAHQEWYNTAPYSQVPEDHRWRLPLLYLVFFIVEVILYFICRWYARYKSAHPGNKLLKYL